MIINSQLDAFQLGARHLAQDIGRSRSRFGFMESDWELLTRDDRWSPEETMRVSGLLVQLIQSSLTISGLPATRLPGQYVAALIVEVVHSCNVIAACWSAPASFDAARASGLTGEYEIIAMEPEQMFSLAMAFLGGDMTEPEPRLPPVRQDGQKTKSRSVENGIG